MSAESGTPSPQNRKAYWTLSGVEFSYWFAIAAGSFLTVFLQKRGARPNDVGFINGVNSLVTILATPFWGMMADRFRSIRKVFILCIIMGSVFWALIPAASRLNLGLLPFMYLIISLSCFFRNPSSSLLDAFVVQRSDIDRVTFTNVRLWGSISYAIMSIALSVILPHTGVNLSFYLFGLTFIPLIVIMASMKNADAGVVWKKVSFKQMGLGRLFKNYYYISYLVFLVLMQAPLNASSAFLPYLLADVGSDTTRYGLLVGYKALLEVPVLIVMKQFRRKFPLPFALIIAGFLNGIDALLYVRAGSLIQILLIQTSEGLASGLLIGASVNYVYSLAPEGLNSTAHTVAAAASAIAAIIGNVFGGILAVTFGIRGVYFVISVSLFISILYFFLSLLFGIKTLKKMLPLVK